MPPPGMTSSRWGVEPTAAALESAWTPARVGDMIDVGA
jgi:hypothetical protein